jgi:K+-transporting ATPase ATPase C chain
VLRHLSIAFRMALITLVVLGVAYPIAMWGVAQVAFREGANGSLVRASGEEIVGSRLIGQAFSSPKYFHGRPSAGGYDGLASGGSNLGPTSAKLRDQVRERVAGALADDPALAARGAPIDMVTASGSGLDPDISVANALAQVPRVAKARRVSENDIERAVRDHTTRRQLGFLGEERVNVLETNLALDGIGP